jgi:hypothetical protein
MGMDLDGWIARVKGGEHLEEWDLKQLCDYVKELLIEESNVQVRKSGTALAGASRPSQLSAIRPLGLHFLTLARMNICFCRMWMIAFLTPADKQSSNGRR